MPSGIFVASTITLASLAHQHRGLGVQQVQGGVGEAEGEQGGVEVALVAQDGDPGGEAEQHAGEQG